MQISIRTALGIERADLDVAGVTLLAGRNGAGKSSVLTAVGCALAGQPLPAGLLKKEGAQVVRDGADGGRVTVRTAEGSASCAWPSASATSEGRPPKASPIAAGLTSLLDMDTKERAQTLAAYLKTDPTKADLVQALRDSDVPVVLSGLATADEAAPMKVVGLDPLNARETAIFRSVTKVWKTVEIDGFDGAHAQATKTGQELKGAWRSVTGEAYGSEKGAKWRARHADLADSLVPDGKSPVAALEDLVARRKEAVDKTTRAAAVAVVDLEGLRQTAAKVPALEAGLKAAQTALAQAREARETLARRSPPKVPEVPMLCPHCSCAVVIEDGRLVPSSAAPDPEAVAQAEKALEAYRYNERVCKASFEKAYDDVKGLEKELAEARAAAAKVASLGATGPTPPAEMDVTAAKEALSQAEKALEAVKQQAEAQRLHKAISANQSLVDLLAPAGLRKAKLCRVLEAANEAVLAPLCKAARWKAVDIAPDLGIRYGGRPVRLCSASEKWRARVTLQVALAGLDGSDVVLIDEMDILHAEARGCVVGLLLAAKVPAVVALTLSSPGNPALFPDLDGAGVGRAYWVEAGIVRPRAEVVAPVARAAE